MSNKWRARGLSRAGKWAAIGTVPVTAASFVIGFTVPASAAPGALAAASTCSPAGSTGLTAAVIATANQSISGSTIDATGCDVGIYIGPGVTGVTINNVTVSGANDHGIFAQATSGLTIQNSTVQGNGVKPTAGINENKAIELDGVSGSTVKNNTVQNNTADGGIGISDDGPVAPGAPNPGPSTPIPSTNDTVNNNVLPNNYGGCDIVVSGYNAGGGTSNITVNNNQIVGHPGQFSAAGPFIGQVVVATDGPGITISGTAVTGNTITGSALAGIVLHANAPGDVISGTTLSGNVLSLNHWLLPFGPPQTAGIAIQAEAGPPGSVPTVTGTSVTGNTITQEYYGVWSKGLTPSTTISGNQITTTAGGQAVFAKPNAYSGYSMVGSDGGVFTFGSAIFRGSLPGSSITPAGRVVGLALTRDDNGYWIAGPDGNVYPFGDATDYGSLPKLGIRPAFPVVGIAPTPATGSSTPGSENGLGYYLVASDGGVFTFGDAQFYGSMGGKHLNQPIVGMAPTPDGKGYWLVASDGGVFSFGDAQFYGSMGGKPLNQPIVGMAASPTGHGYYLVARDGGVFTFGDAAFYGSMGGKHLNAPINGMMLGPPAPATGPSTPPAGGYTLVASDGGVFTFGNAPFLGSAVGLHDATTIMGAAVNR